MSLTPRILPCGDAAVAVEFGTVIDSRVNARVLALDARVRAFDTRVRALDARVLSSDPAAPRGLTGLVETVPTYRSLLVHYDPVVTDFARVTADLLALAADLPDAPVEGRLWRVPVVYGGAFGIDLEAVAERHGLTPGEVIAKHAAAEYQVYMIGFLPGFAYLGGLDPALATPRHDTPRAKTPAGTISIGGVQAAIASIEGPSGWHLIGRTPMRNFMAGRDPAFLVGAGDRVRFVPLDAAHWDTLDRAAAAGEPVAEVVQ